MENGILFTLFGKVWNLCSIIKNSVMVMVIVKVIHLKSCLLILSSSLLGGHNDVFANEICILTLTTTRQCFK